MDVELILRINDKDIELKVDKDILDGILKDEGYIKIDTKEDTPINLDESKWKVHPFYNRYEVHPEGYVRDSETKLLLCFTKYRKEEHHKPQFINSNIVDKDGSHTVALHKMVADTFIPIPWYLKEGYSYSELSVGLKDGNYESIEGIKAYNLAWYAGRIRGNTPMIKVLDLEDNVILYFPNTGQLNKVISDYKLPGGRFEILR